MLPLDLLKQELEKLIHSRDKSVISFEKGEISEELHNTHMGNLTPLIENYKYVIRVVEQYA